MTEFKRKPRSFWKRLWICLRYGYLPGVSPDFWTEATLVPATPDPAPEIPTDGLSIRCDSHGIGKVLYKGVELREVQAIYISGAPLQPVEVTLLMSGFDGIDLQADLCALRFEPVAFVQRGGTSNGADVK